MHIDKNRLRRTLAAVAITTSAGLALAAGGAVRAETNATPDPGAVEVTAGSHAEAPPGQRPGQVAAPAAHVVVAGDSYWAIAESFLDDDATPAEVLAKTEELMTLNSTRLGADDPAMIHPGDDVYLEKTRPAAEVVVREDARVLVAAAERSG
jgi:hypothetical protein